MRRSARYATVVAAGAARIGAETIITQGTTATGDLTADGYTWAQGTPMVIDNYGNYIAAVQHSPAGTNTNSFVVSNDGGATWADPTHTGMAAALGELFLVRGGMAYDTINDLIHVLWNAAATTDGIIYRRYSITRDGSNNITALTRVAGINLQLDFQGAGTMSYEHPILLWLPIGTNGTLIACWGARNSAGAAKNEVRASLRTLSNSAADNTAANWAALDGSADTTTIGNAPAVPYNYLVSNNNGAIVYPSLGIKRSGANQYDLTLLYADGAAVTAWQTKLITHTAGSTWNVDGAITKLTDIKRSGVDGGYSLKHQLGTEPRHDTANDRMWFGVGTWNGTTDTWSMAYQNADGTLGALIDVYAAPGAHVSADDFVTGDVAVLNGKIFATYTDLPDKDAYAVLYSTAGTVIDGPTLIFDAAPVDIPTVYPDLENGSALVLFRDFNIEAINNPPVYTPPYDGYFVTVPILSG